MTSALETIRYHSGIAGEEVADMVDSLEREVSSLREQVATLTKERDEWKNDVINGGNAGYLRDQLAALAEQNEKQRKALLSANDFIFTLQQDLHSERCTDWYPEGAHNAATAMSESMRLIGNSCADFTDVVEALSLPDLASPVLNRIRAEGMEMAAKWFNDHVDNRTDTWQAQELRRMAAELRKTNV